MKVVRLQAKRGEMARGIALGESRAIPSRDGGEVGVASDKSRTSPSREEVEWVASPPKGRTT